VYDHLDFKQTLPKTKTVKLQNDVLLPQFTQGFEYSDLWVDDARLTILNALDAHERGAVILPRTALVKAIHEDNLWHIQHEKGQAQAKLLINAAGPWVSEVNALCGLQSRARVRHVKGSHIIVPRLYEGEKAYTCQNADGRVLFALPYEQDFTLLGTTDEDYDGDLNAPSISQAEKDYLLQDANAYFKKQLSPSDIVESFCGIRPLYDDGASKAKDATRDYVLERHENAVCVYGGKITTARRLAQEVLNDKKQDWTAHAALPGGDFTPAQIPMLLNEFCTASPEMTPALATHYLRTYGTRARRFISQDLGAHYGAGLYAAEVNYLKTHEWAVSHEDILKRRTKLYLKQGINLPA
jgi:glycerol-3-phosphate dehydrogenase